MGQDKGGRAGGGPFTRVARRFRGAVRGGTAAGPPAAARPDAGQADGQDAAQAEEIERLRKQLVRARRDVHELRLIVDELGGQLAQANHPGASDDRELGFVFVATYGRSGSTLLQGILNDIDGYLIRGENGGALHRLYRYHAQLMSQHRAGRVGAEPTDSWYGIGAYSDDLAMPALRRLVLSTLLRPEPTTRVIGFKEIKWTYDDLDEYVGFLTRLFPGSRFIVNTRNLADVAQSKWWARTENAAEQLERTQQRLLALAEPLGDAFFHVHYDDYVSEPERLATLFTWLGEPFDVDRVRAVLNVPHGY